MLIRNGIVHDAVHAESYVADILIKDGKIAKIGENLAADGAQVIDATGLHVYPGLVEAHCHMGLHMYGSAKEDYDVNEKSDVLTPQLRGIDAFNPGDPAMQMALAEGITTVCAGPGSANVVGGTFVAVKTHGKCVDNMVIRNDVAMKCAFGENPKNVYRGKSDGTRMATAAKLRELLLLTKDYLKRKELAGDDYAKQPKFDMKLEAMIPVIKGEMPLKAHAHRADDICTAIRIAKEFDLKMTIEHCTEGHLVAEEVAAAGFPVAVGPLEMTASKPELMKRSMETPAILAKAGVPVSITCDSPVIAQTQLAASAGVAVKYGMDPHQALQAITIRPAQHIGIADRVGSLEVGKDADLFIADGDILINSTKVLKVVLDGTLVVEK